MPISPNVNTDDVSQHAKDLICIDIRAIPNNTGDLECTMGAAYCPLSGLEPQAAIDLLSKDVKELVSTAPDDVATDVVNNTVKEYLENTNLLFIKFTVMVSKPTGGVLIGSYANLKDELKTEKGIDSERLLAIVMDWAINRTDSSNPFKDKINISPYSNRTVN